MSRNRLVAEDLVDRRHRLRELVHRALGGVEQPLDAAFLRLSSPNASLTRLASFGHFVAGLRQASGLRRELVLQVAQLGERIERIGIDDAVEIVPSGKRLRRPAVGCGDEIDRRVAQHGRADVRHVVGIAAAGRRRCRP